MRLPWTGLMHLIEYEKLEGIILSDGNRHGKDPKDRSIRYGVTDFVLFGCERQLVFRLWEAKGQLSSSNVAEFGIESLSDFSIND